MKYESNLDIYSILEHYFIASIYNKGFIQACDIWLSIWKATFSYFYSTVVVFQHVYSNYVNVYSNEVNNSNYVVFHNDYFLKIGIVQVFWTDYGDEHWLDYRKMAEFVIV